MASHRPRLILIISVAALVLGVASAAALAAAGPLSPRRWFPGAPASSSCATPALTGSVVDVTLTDMGGMMGRGGMMGPAMMGNGRYGPGAPNNGYSWQNGYPWPGMGMMRIFVVPSTVLAGQVSLRVHNTGALNHEVAVLPLNPGQYPGQRAIGIDGKVDESGSLGEASSSCGADRGDEQSSDYGIVPGAAGWTTITLPAGRYELLCNIAGHYGAGMYAQLNVAASR